MFHPCWQKSTVPLENFVKLKFLARQSCQFLVELETFRETRAALKLKHMSNKMYKIKWWKSWLLKSWEQLCVTSDNQAFFNYVWWNWFFYKCALTCNLYALGRWWSKSSREVRLFKRHSRYWHRRNSIVRDLEDVLIRKSFKLNKSRGQCYDGCGTMKGKNNGVVIEIKEEEQRKHRSIHIPLPIH